VTATRSTTPLALALVVGLLLALSACAPSGAEHDADLAEELDAAPWSRFDESFYLGEPGDGRIRILPMEEWGPRQDVLARMQSQARDVEALKEHLVEPKLVTSLEFPDLLALALAESEQERSGTRPEGVHAQAMRERLTDTGDELFDELMIETQLAVPMVIDTRDEVFARRALEVAAELEQEFAPGEAVVIVFTGAGHVPGVARRIAAGLGREDEVPDLDLERDFREVLAGLEDDLSSSAKTRLTEALTARVPDVDLGPVRIRGDVHSPFFDAVRHVGFEFFVPGMARYETDYSVSIQRYADVVDEVRGLARAGKHVVFLVELEATTYVDSHADVLREGRFEEFKRQLAAQAVQDGAPLDDGALEARAQRLMPYFLIGPTSVLVAKLDEQTLPAPLQRAAAE
jgi:hypothetical protein